MKRNSLLAAGAIFAVLACVGAVQANPGGGGGGAPGNGSSEKGFGHGDPLAFFNGNAARALIAPPQPSGSTVLPGGTYMRLDGYKAGREVFVDSPEHGRFKGQHIKTTFNPRTGITSVWLRDAGGGRIGIHTDADGNQMISHH